MVAAARVPGSARERWLTRDREGRPAGGPAAPARRRPFHVRPGGMRRGHIRSGHPRLRSGLPPVASCLCVLPRQPRWTGTRLSGAPKPVNGTGRPTRPTGILPAPLQLSGDRLQALLEPPVVVQLRLQLADPLLELADLDPQPVGLGDLRL